MQSDNTACLRRVLLAFDVRNPTVRQTLSGIRRFERERRTWSLSMPLTLRDEVYDYLKHWKPDGILGTLDDTVYAQAVARGGAGGLDVQLDVHAGEPEGIQ